MFSSAQQASSSTLLNSVQLLFDLQDVNAIGQSISGCLDPEDIAHRVTEALVERFQCAFARIWLTDNDQQALTLVASSGLYTHTNGSFAHVPMGAYKVGKIAQNRVPFLSNYLPDETWVKDRDWAIAKQIQGFAGYPLTAGDRVLGVLAAFSHEALAPEFLEVLQMLCLTTTIALDAALQSRKTIPQVVLQNEARVLSDQLAKVLTSTQLMLVGTERDLPASTAYALLRGVEVLTQLDCSYCRLTYDDIAVSLDAIAISPPNTRDTPPASFFSELQLMTLWLGGALSVQPDPKDRVFELTLTLPYVPEPEHLSVSVQCQQSVLQMAFTHLCLKAGLSLSNTPPPSKDDSRTKAVLLTDRLNMPTSSSPIIWIQHSHRGQVPIAAQAVVTLDILPQQLYAVVAQVAKGQAAQTLPSLAPVLSEREQEIMQLLSQGFRDRDIAKQLHISESTVRFHVNNTLTKLKAKNRYQAVYEATSREWI
ncbi:GAF domain-containing protein [Acaryochloris sp. 'Moss Beach']|uniref:LuxR C-terminal-related transcriptional regulator n=1 Tax=Acaryochloris sp. 'Moss Beach' TaxID=2740837 RepID=UPI001F36AABE|nr:LuxR C-terminal-related transcriptional regulator [Acaryochloris sp. 'Moss Beach']UJB71098.1 GAF domain-containing protein [Acaryochloris sp. 'Moss Beach']